MSFLLQENIEKFHYNWHFFETGLAECKTKGQKAVKKLLWEPQGWMMDLRELKKTGEDENELFAYI